MEAPDTYNIYQDHLRRWLNITTDNRFLGDLTVTREGFRTYYFAAVEGLDFDELTDLISERFFHSSRILGAFPDFRIRDNAAVFELAHSNMRVHITFGPISREETKDKQWVKTDIGRDAIPELSFAMDIDVSRSSDPAMETNRRNLFSFIQTAHTLADQASISLVEALRG
ncbi:MAG: hypothetical protein IH861_02530 [Chloroflexi bacterium]|nr:hypothetical protein [Chloroflexota bacterium]